MLIYDVRLQKENSMSAYLLVQSTLYPIDQHHLERLQGAGVALQLKEEKHRGFYGPVVVARIESHAAFPLSAVSTVGMTCAAANAYWEACGRKSSCTSTYYKPGKVLRSGEGMDAFCVRELLFLEIDVRESQLEWKPAGTELPNS